MQKVWKKPFPWLVLLLILLAAPALSLCMRQGVYVGNLFLARENAGAYVQDAEHAVYLERTEAGVLFDIRLGSVVSRAELVWDGNQAVLTYEEGARVEGLWTEGGQLVDDTFTPLYTLDQQPIGAIDDTNVTISLATLSDCLCRMDRSWLQTFASSGRVLLGMALYLLGCADFLWPDQMYAKLAKWQMTDAELTKEGRAIRKYCGLVVMGVGVFVMYSQLFLR